MGGSRRALCACRHVKRSSFAGAGAKTRSTNVGTGAHDSDSAPAYARREPSQSHGKARCVCLPRSSCAVAPSRQAAQGHPVNTGRGIRGGLLSVTFLGRARKVTSRRAAPGFRQASSATLTFPNQTLILPRETPINAFVDKYSQKAAATRRSFACSRKLMTCSRLMEGKPARKSSIESPASR